MVTCPRLPTQNVINRCFLTLFLLSWLQHDIKNTTALYNWISHFVFSLCVSPTLLCLTLYSSSVSLMLLLSPMVCFYNNIYAGNTRGYRRKNALFPHSAAGQDLCADQYSGCCFHSLWILMQPCITEYDFDIVPSLQPLHISDTDLRRWLAPELTAADWLWLEGGQRLHVQYLTEYISS